MVLGRFSIDEIAPAFGIPVSRLESIIADETRAVDRGELVSLYDCLAALIDAPLIGDRRGNSALALGALDDLVARIEAKHSLAQRDQLGAVKA